MRKHLIVTGLGGFGLIAWLTILLLNHYRTSDDSHVPASPVSTGRPADAEVISSLDGIRDSGPRTSVDGPETVPPQDLSKLTASEICQLLEQHVLTSKDLEVLSETMRDDVAVERAGVLLSSIRPKDWDALLEGLQRCPREYPNPQGKVLGERDRQTLDAIRTKYTGDIAALAAECLADISIHKRLQWSARVGVYVWREGQTRTAPDVPSTEGGFRQIGDTGMHDRHVRFEYTTANSPELEAKLARLEELKVSMLREQFQFVNALP